LRKSLDIELLNFRKDLDIRQENDIQFIFDPVRKKKIVLQPEELVRQLFIQFLLQFKKYPLNFMRVEKGLVVNKLQKRADIIVYSRLMRPFLIIECKAFNVPIQEETFRQLSRYNISLSAPYLVVTNGLEHYCSQVDLKSEHYIFKSEIPNYPDLGQI